MDITLIVGPALPYCSQLLGVLLIPIYIVLE